MSGPNDVSLSPGDLLILACADNQRMRDDCNESVDVGAKITEKGEIFMKTRYFPSWNESEALKP